MVKEFNMKGEDYLETQRLKLEKEKKKFRELSHLSNLQKALKSGEDLFIVKKLSPLHKKVIETAHLTVKDQAKLLNMKSSTLYVHHHTLKKVFCKGELVENS